MNQRAAGILMHPTSFPGGHGIGDLGDEAYAFVDYLVDANQSRWQILPLGPTGYGDSPYASFSSFAGNPLLISLDRISDEFELEIDLECPAELSVPGKVRYGEVIDWKMPQLHLAAKLFLDQTDAEALERFNQFCEDESDWLDDYALFMAVKQSFQAKARRDGLEGAIWNNYWDKDIALRKPEAIKKWREKKREDIAVEKVLQFFFFGQWLSLKQYANQRGIQIIGDLPIFVALDSADVWSSPGSFQLDASGKPLLVSGVPPDYFSETGQRWGNPVYNWEAMKRDGFSWWRRRFEGTRALVDIIRVDHFRGFEACWSIPAEEPTAVNGSWVPAPGEALFRSLRDDLGELPIVAEDLGVITPAVERLRDQFGFPGMRVLQFAFDGTGNPGNLFLPHNHRVNNVVYTGTHDNDTTAGWFSTCTAAEREAIERYLGHPYQDIVWEFIRMAMASVAETAIIPMQDVLGLDSQARMNTPASQGENWTWRVAPDYRHGDSAERLSELVEIYGRG